MEYRREGTAGDYAQGQSGESGVGAESVYETAREFDGEGHFDIADRKWVLELLCPIEVAIGLAPGDGTSLGEAFGGRGQVRVLPKQSAGQVEPLGFLGMAGAGHMTYKYSCLCHKSRTLSSSLLLPLLSIRDHPLKLEVIFCVQAVITAPCGVPIVVSDHSPSSLTPAFSHFRINFSTRRSEIRSPTSTISFA